MNEQERKKILDRAAKRKEALADAQPAAAAPAGTPVGNPASLRALAAATGKAQLKPPGAGIEIRIIDENNPPTQVGGGARRTGGATVRQAPPSAQGRSSYGARVVTPDAPGTRVRTTPQTGAYGATVVPTEQPGAPAAPGPSTPPPPGPSFQQTLRTPMRAAAAPAAPGAAPGSAPATDMQAQIAMMGRQAAAQGGSPGAPMVTPGVTPGAAPVSVGDVTVVMSQHARPNTLDGQVRTLRAAGVEDHSMWCWVNPGGTKLNDGLIGRLRRFQANHDVGPWFRWSLTACIPTKYTLVIDDDCTPGPQWLQLALQRLEAAEARGERVVVAAAGNIYQRDAVDSAVPLGPESLHRQEIEVDIGRGAWLMPTDLARSVLSHPQVGSPLATAVHVAAAMQDADAQIVVLPYIHNQREGWGMLESPQGAGSLSQRFDREAQQTPGHPNAAALRAADFDAYRHAAGWKPMCVVEDELAAADAAAAAAVPPADPPPSSDPPKSKEVTAESSP